MTSLLPRLNAWLHSPDKGQELPVLHRLALVYFVLPLIVWLVGWFEWWVGVPAAVLLTAGFWNALSGSWRTPLRPAVFALLIVAAGWVLLTPAGGVLGPREHDVSDWFKHRALLSELGANAWPVRPTNPIDAYLPADETDADQPLLRYYLGWYMVPGLAASWFGLEALYWAVPLWQGCGAALIVLMFASVCRGWRETAAAVAILVCFSGMDVGRNFLLEGVDWLDWSTAFRSDGGWPVFGPSRGQMEWPRFDDAWVYLQYHSNTVGLMYNPQHFVAAALGALLVVQMSDRPRFLAVSGVVLATVVFWSPFVALGLLPLLAVPLCQHGPRPFLRWQNLLLTPPVGLLLVAYLTSGAGEVPNGFLWDLYGAGTVAKLLPVFYLTEFGVLVVLLAALGKEPSAEERARPAPRRKPPSAGKRRTVAPHKTMPSRAPRRRGKRRTTTSPSWAARGLAFARREPFLAASVATLFLVPFYSLGLYNDLVVNASRPAMVVLGYGCLLGIIAHGRSPVRGEWRGRLALSGLVGVLAVGAFTPLVEIAAAVSSIGVPSVLRYERGPWSIFADLAQSIKYQYAARDVPPPLRVLLRDTPEAARVVPEKGAHIIADQFDVYLDGKRLIYAKTPCSQQDLEPIFMLNVVPLHEHDLSDASRRTGQRFDNLNFVFFLQGWQRGETCVTHRQLPDYAIDRIVVGQGVVGQRPIWLREYRFDPRQISDG